MEAAKQRILAEIKRLAKASSGKPPGVRAFESETGIKESDWFPNLWLRWGDALQEAGFTRNTFTTEGLTNEFLLEQYARLAQRLGRLPIQGEMIRESKATTSFPNQRTFDRRFGGKKNLLTAVAEYCRSRSALDDVLKMCEAAPSGPTASTDIEDARRARVTTRFVYLIKSGKHYKIGRTNSVSRRTYELGIKIPVPPQTIHYIETDDPTGIEAYWHKRFEAKRGEGEWFNLTPDDVAGFKRWKKIS